jgi:hypothetical protein
MQLLAIKRAGIMSPNGRNLMMNTTTGMGTFRSTVSQSATRSTRVEPLPSITQKPPEVWLTLHQLRSPWAIARRIAKYSQLKIRERDLAGDDELCVGDA